MILILASHQAHGRWRDAPGLEGDRMEMKPHEHDAGVIPSPRLSAVARLIALALSAGALAVLVIAATIMPSPAGVGSHTQLGLQPCQFLARTRVPAPTCGMTTSFARFVRGNLVASLYVRPMGAALAAATAMTVIAGLYIGATGRPAHRLLRVLPPRPTAIAVMSFAVLAWPWKIVIHLSGIDGWR